MVNMYHHCARISEVLKYEYMLWIMAGRLEYFHRSTKRVCLIITKVSHKCTSYDIDIIY